MATIIEEIELIHVDLVSNHNKVWRGKLFDNNDLITEWGRVGYGCSTTNFPSAGKREYDRMVKSKLKKGYTPTKTIKSDGQVQIVSASSNMHKIALEQISLKTPALTTLVKRLVEVNVHNIVNATSIKYDSKSGLFQTPLGVVTPDGITEAKTLLVSMKDEFDKGSKPLGILSDYLRIIPHNYGMRLRPDSILSDRFFNEENDTLDALTSSFDALSQASAPKKAKDPAAPKVFDVTLDILPDGKEKERLIKKYYDTRKDQHVCKHLKPVNIYALTITDVFNQFTNKGAKLEPVKELWHGSRTANVLSILSKGLKINPPNSVNRTGAMFGRGLYFATASTKSLGYSYGFWDGRAKDTNCFLFVADVALGKTYVPRRCESLPAGYDSLWAKANQSGVLNDEIVIGKEYQCNLKYLIEFE